jgi:hypothetical protein
VAEGKSTISAVPRNRKGGWIKNRNYPGMFPEAVDFISQSSSLFSVNGKFPVQRRDRPSGKPAARYK